MLRRHNWKSGIVAIVIASANPADYVWGQAPGDYTGPTPRRSFAETAYAAEQMGGVSLSRLDASNLSTLAPATSGLGVVPGDILVTNPFMKVVLKTTVDAEQTGVGRAVLWNGLPDKRIQIQAGVPITWASADAGCNGRVAVVRYHHTQPNWQADLTYKLFDNGPWLDVTLTVTNKSTEETLEIPALFQLQVPRKAEVDERDKQIWIENGESSMTVALFTTADRFRLEKLDAQNWWFGSDSGDPEPSAIKRVSRKLPLIKRLVAKPPIRPIEASRDWPREMKDRENWFRIEPGQQRTVHWKIVAGTGQEHTKTLVQFAKSGKEPDIQLVPSAQPMVQDPAPTTVTSRRVVGNLRGPAAATNQSVSPPEVQTLKPPTVPPRTWATKPVNPPPPTEDLRGPQLVMPESERSAPVQTLNPPLILPQSLLEVPRLPNP